jgi:ABC-2 type transport system permease protein
MVALLRKDVLILRRSPLLVGVLIVYPVVIALMIGFAVSSPPGKPTVAIYSGVKRGHGKLSFGSEKINVGRYANELYASVHPLFEPSPAAAIAAVRSGRALAALIVPRNITAQIDSLIRTGTGNPTVQVVLNDRDPLQRALVDQAISTRIDQVEGAVSRQVLKVAVADLQVVLTGGSVSFLGQEIPLLGLRATRSIALGAAAQLPPRSPFRAALRQVAGFASLAIEGLSFAGPALGGLQTPLTVQRTELAGATTPVTSYAVAIAVVFSLMFLALLLGAALLALERSENTYRRLVRGLITREGLLVAKVLLAAACGALVTVLLSAVVSAFTPLAWSRFALWVLVAAVGGLAFAGLGVLVGALAREVATASLMAFGCSLPIAFTALVPRDAVSGAVGALLDGFSFVFPFRAALAAFSDAFSGAGGGLPGDLAHLALLALAYGLLARLALVRFGD